MRSRRWPHASRASRRTSAPTRPSCTSGSSRRTSSAACPAYSAGYYSYLWADALTADAAEGFLETGGLYDAATARRLHDCILSVGDSIAPDEAFHQFRGRDVDPEALMRYRGFAAG